MIRHHRLIWAGIWRDATRTSYTLLSIVVAFLLFGLLQGVAGAFSHSVAAANLNRLYVDSRFGQSQLPKSFLAKIEQLEGVASVSYTAYFAGSYQDARQPVNAVAVDAERYFAIYTELRLPADQLEKLQKTRDGAVISRELAQRLGWKIGDRVPLVSSVWSHKPDGSTSWSFEVVGIFDAELERTSRSEFVFNYDYFDEARLYRNGTVSWYVAKISDPSQATRIAGAIDAMFANSSDETLTQNEQEMAQAVLRQHGDINLIVNLIMGAVFFTLLLLTANTMTQSVRERIPEFAVLKTLGYSSTTLALLILSEALWICVVAALCGLGLAWLFYPLLQALAGAPGGMPPWVPLLGVLIAVAVAAVTSLLPIARLQRVSVVAALSGR